MIKQYFNDMRTLLSHILEKNRKELGDLPAIISDGNTISHIELYDRIEKTVQYLGTHNLPHDIIVALRFRDPVKHLICHISLLKMGICQISIDPKELYHIQKKIISTGNIDLVIQDIQPNNVLLPQTLYMSNNLYSETSIYPWNRNTKSPKSLQPLDDMLQLIIGSGTTGEPKIFFLHSSSLAHRIQREAEPMHYRSGERHYVYAELYYSFPKLDAIGALLWGLTLVLPTKKPDLIIEFCIEHQVDHLTLTGSQAIRMLSEVEILGKTSSLILPNLKSLSVTSMLITDSVRQKILDTITDRLYIKYGTNEIGECTLASPDDIRKHPGTVGQTYRGIKLQIVDDDGNPCPMGKVGNILIRSVNPVMSYLNNPKASKTAFTKEGYYPGDLGRLTEDGNLIFEGRKDDMMIYQGVNIYPREIESVLEVHPYVIESAAFPLYSKEQEHIPFAVVSVCRKISEKELLHWCASELGWKGPQRIFFVKTLPRNDAGKVLKRVLAKEMAKMLTQTG